MKVVYSFLITIMLGVMFARGADTPTSDPDSPDFVKASFLIASPGPAIYQVSGHSMLRMRCPSAGLDYIFTFESEYAGVWGNLFHQVYGRVAAFDPDEYLRQFREEGRSVCELPLDLTPYQERELWRALDRMMLAGGEKFNIRSRHCTSVFLDAIDIAAAPAQIAEEGSDIIGKPNGAVVSHFLLPKSPWRCLILNLVMGGEADTPGSLQSQTAPIVLLQQYMHYYLRRSDGSLKPLFAGKPEVIIPLREPDPDAPPLITPVAAGIIVLILSGSAVVAGYIRCARFFVIAAAVIIYTLGALIGIVIIASLATPSRIGSWMNLNLLVYNPIPLLLYIIILCRRRKSPLRLTRLILAVYSVVALIHAAAGPLVTLSTDWALSLLSLSIALSYLPTTGLLLKKQKTLKKNLS